MAISLACRLALTAADVDHEVTIVSSQTGETKQEPYLSINPMGEVPVLEHDGVALAQTVAILVFIADSSGKGWTSASAVEREKALSIMILASVEVQNAWKMINRPSRYVSGEAAQAELVDHAILKLDAAYLEVERQLQQLDVDSQPGILQYYLCVFTLWKQMAPAGKHLSATPNLDALKERVMSSPELRKVIEEDIASYTALAG
jgi:glutathione S-transferase